MKVCHVQANISWGGAEIYSVEIATWQRQSGLDVSYWCYEGSPIHKECTKRGIPTVTDPLPRHFSPRHFSGLVETIRKNQFTHLHLHWNQSVWAFFGIKKFCDVKLFLHCHLWMTHKKKDPLHYLAYKQFDKILVPGQMSKELHLTKVPVKESQIDFCRYSLELEKSTVWKDAHAKRPNPERKKWGLPDDALILGFFGRIDKQKGVYEFLKAVQKPLELYPNAHALVVGDATKGEAEAAEYEVQVNRLLDESPHRNRIHRIPHQAHFHPILSCADVMVMPSYQECYSILFIHGFALGIPIVSTQAGGTPDLIAVPDRGWLVPPRRYEELEEVLCEIAANPSQIEKKSEACLKYVWANHSHNDIIRNLTKTYLS